MSPESKAIRPFAPYFSRPADAVLADLTAFAVLLRRWNDKQNLVSRGTLDELWSRHIADSLQVLPLLEESDANLLDLGSGGGFPAIPLAIALKGRARLTLVEAIGKKASFLKTVNRELDLGLSVLQERAESLEPTTLGPVDVITSRALASLTNLLTLAAPLFGAGTRAIFHKGRDYGEEVAESRASWQYDVVVNPSQIDDSGVLLVISNLTAKSSR
jgi:16S rRNA (guanine527-N7)-methyltransferase